MDVRNRPPVVTLPGTKSIISWWIWHLSLDMRAAVQELCKQRGRAAVVELQKTHYSSRRSAIEDPLK